MDSREPEYVGFWPRVGATLIDAFLLMLFAVPLTYFVYGDAFFGSERFVLGPANILINWVAPAVVVILFWVARGQTPGKMAIRARIVDADTRSPISLGTAVVRYIGYFISMIGLFVGTFGSASIPRSRAGTITSPERS